MEMTGKQFLLLKMMETSMELERGNKKSKRIGKMLKKVGNVFAKDEYKFEMMMRSMEKGYTEMSEKYNREFFDAMGGKRGSGEMMEIELGDVSKKTGKDIEKLINGIDPEGFYHLQIMLPFTRDMGSNEAPNGTDGDLPTFKFMVRHLSNILWAIFFSVFYEDYANELDKVFDQYNTNPNWN